MRNLEAIETELAAAREALSEVKGTPAEVYSRIVGYYRSVRNWNRGKREEYGERVMFQPDASLLASCTPGAFGTPGVPDAPGRQSAQDTPGIAGNTDTAWAPGGFNTVQTKSSEVEERLLLFVRPACPACPSAKAAAKRLGIPMELYDADTDEGLAEAMRRQVLSTPTAILLSSSGEELGRARDAKAIEQLLEITEAIAV